MPTATSSHISLLTLSDSTRWQQLLGSVEHDFYHEDSYHAFCQQRGDGIAYMAVYEEGTRVLVWPYLLRPIEQLGAGGFHDVTSVYGYPGPLARRPSAPFVERALASIKSLWRSQNAVTAFTRLHPLLGNDTLLGAMNPLDPCGTTIAIDLIRPADEIWRGYRKTLRHEISRARKLGVAVEVDLGLVHLGRFVDLYHETMTRNAAPASYFFDHAYFEGLFEAFPGRAHLFTAFHAGAVIAGAVFIETAGIVQYHLGAAESRSLPLAPTKLLLDEVRRWATARGNKHFHLGGGRGGQQDSLFAFKAAFSKDRFPFFVWKDVLRPGVYQDLCGEHERIHRVEPQTSSYFPAYRAVEPAS